MERFEWEELDIKRTKRGGEKEGEKGSRQAEAGGPEGEREGDERGKNWKFANNNEGLAPIPESIVDKRRDL